MQPARSDVVVVGGGLAGSTAALAFRRAGCSVTLVERRDLARDPNRGDILHPLTQQVVERLGLLPRLEARGATTLRRIIVTTPDGDLGIQRNHLGFRILNHAEMEGAFLEAAETAGVHIVHDTVRSIEPGWTLTTDEHTLDARFLVGADGASSLVRSTLGIELADVHDYENWLVVLHADAPEWLGDESGWTLYHPDGAIFVLPTTPVGRIRLIMTIPPAEVRDWTGASETEIAQRLEQRHPALAGIRITKRGGSHVYKLRRSHAARYWAPGAALTGDAAHTTHTMGGMGLNMAIQDSGCLATLVGPVLLDPNSSPEALTQALEQYEATRRPANDATLARAHASSATCGPGREAYELGVEMNRAMFAAQDS